ncbi:MAG: rhodanese-like domain-containing protein [Elusimicrobiota bacterium]|nr:rhodanese-like domain-containing protein [Elusimicrobiota bacterium]
MSDKTYDLIDAEAAHRVLASKAPGQLVDVREVSEVDALRVEGAMNIPLSRLGELAARLDRGAPVYLLCRSGSRAAEAAAKLDALGHRDILVVRGGLEAWTAAGKPVVRGASRVWSLERQVRFAAGSMVFTGTALGFAVDPRWLLLPGFVSAGLMFSAVTDTCGMALVLGRLPWNRGSGGSCGR